MKKISFITVNYATKVLIEKFINNLLQVYENCEIIFVDNASPDGSADLVENLFGSNPKITLIKTQNNGLAAGCNLALEKATGDYFIYIGTDAFPTKENIEQMIEYMDKNPDVGIATPRLYTRDGKTDMDAHRGFPTPWVSLSHLLGLDILFPHVSLVNGYNLLSKDINTNHEIDACISHFMFVRPEIHQKIGKWDTTYWLYGEDIDLCYRVKEAGYKVMYLGTIPVLHYKGASVGRKTSTDIVSATNESIEQKAKTKTTRLKLIHESTNAMRIFYKKHYIKKYPAPLNALVLFGIWCNEQLKIFKSLFRSHI